MSIDDIKRLTVKQINAWLSQIAWVHEKMEGVSEDDLPTYERVKRRLQKRKASGG